MTVNKKGTPYFNDYDENKMFHEVLFKPGLGLQCRELNELQSMQLRQIKLIGDGIYKNGAVIIPGGVTYESKVPYIVISLDKGELSQYKDLIIEGETYSVKAKVDQFIEKSDSQYTLFVNYINSGSNGTHKTFYNNETFTATVNNQVLTGTVLSSGTGSRFSVKAGVYYVNGRFLESTDQSIVLDTFSSTPSYCVGFDVDETVVTVNEDPSLYDNASGYPNHAAPGADRLKIGLKLVKYPLIQLNTLPSTFIEMFRVDAGEVVKSIKNTEYSSLADTLARRTFDESGNYTVNPFQIQISDNGNETFNVTIGTGKAYVKGYEIENVTTKNITVPKARQTESFNNAALSPKLGSYVDLSEINIIPQFNYFQQVEILNESKELIGHARIMMIANINTAYRVYMFDILNASFIKDTTFFTKARYIRGVVNDKQFMGTIKNMSPDIKDTGYGLIFQLPIDNVKTLINQETGKIDTTLQVVSQYFTKSTTEGKVVISAQSNESFIAQNSSVTMGAFIDANLALIDNLSDKCVIGGTPTGAIITIDLGKENAGRDVVLNLVCVKENASYKAKIPTTESIVYDQHSANGKYDLKKADVYAIESITDSSGRNVTSNFTLYNNKSLTCYDVSYVVANVDDYKMPITIKFKYFQHGHGDFFCVDSYNSINFEDIPVENGVSLGDVLDFRPRKDDSGNDFIGYGSNTSLIPQPNTVITTDLSSYLPRRDKVYVTSNGEFGVVQGTPKRNPSYPDDLIDTMSLCTLDIPAYTGNIKSIAIDEINNKRYTMSDIGKLEDRIVRIEEEVALSKLEKEVAYSQLYKDNGDAYYKNGFFVDSFVDHTSSELSNDDYHAAVGQGMLAPEVNVQNVPAKLFSTNGVVVNNGIATLPYSEVVLINNSQQNGSLSIPKSFDKKWMPHVKLTPSFSSMFEGDKAMTSFSGDLTDVLPSNKWNSWGLHWVGVNSETFTDSLLKMPSNMVYVNGRVVDKSYTPKPHFSNIVVDVKGFKPNTRVYVLFGGDSDVTNYCYTDVNNTASNQLITNIDGKLQFTIKLPDSFIKNLSAGTYPIVIADVKTMDNWNDISCFAIEYYTVSGPTNQEQQRTISTRSTAPKFSQIDQYNNSIAQLFTVEGTNGKFITSIDLYFSGKSNYEPLNIEIREVESNLPNNNIIPCTKVTLTPAEVNVSSNGSAKTVVKFDCPIYLQSGLQYSIIITSSSDEYVLYTCDSDSSVTNSGSKVVAYESPYLSTLMYGTGNGDWAPFDKKQLAVNVNRAKFDIKHNAAIQLTYDENYNAVRVNTISSTKNDQHITLDINEGHSLMVGNILHITDLNYFQLGFKYSSTAEDFYVTEIGVNYVKIQHINNAIGVSEQDASIPSPQIKVIGSSRADMINISNSNLILLGTKIDYSITAAVSENGVPYTTSQTYNIEPNNNLFLSNEIVLSNAYDEKTNFMGNRTFRINHVLTSDDDSLSPVVDIERTDIIIPYFKIGEERFKGYNQHISKVMQITTPAESLRTYLSVMCPSGGDVTVYCRCANSDQEILSKEWKKMDNSTKTMVSSVYVDRLFTLESTPFTYFQVKVNFESTSKANVPFAKRLRVIALT